MSSVSRSRNQEKLQEQVLWVRDRVASRSRSMTNRRWSRILLLDLCWSVLCAMFAGSREEIEQLVLSSRFQHRPSKLLEPDEGGVGGDVNLIAFGFSKNAKHSWRNLGIGALGPVSFPLIILPVSISCTCAWNFSVGISTKSWISKRESWNFLRKIQLFLRNRSETGIWLF